jgi:hypothetical protein
MVLSTLRQLLSRRSRPARATPRSKGARLHLECLEDRRLLSSVPVAHLDASYAGLSAITSPAASIPPDTDLAVGPDRILETVNTSIQVLSKATGNPVPGFPQSLQALFNRPAGEDFTDPVVTYDDAARRFYVGVLDFVPLQGWQLQFAVSNTSNPQDGFTRTLIDVRENVNTPALLLPDYPKIGYNADAIVLTFNMLDLGENYVHARVLSISKAAVLNGGAPAAVTFLTDLPGNDAPPGGMAHSTLAVATMHGAAPGGPMYFVEENLNSLGNSIRVGRMDNVLANLPAFQWTDLPVAPYVAPPSTRQPNGNLIGADNDARMLNAEWRNNRLAASHNVGLPADRYSHARWYEIDTGSGAPSLVEQGSILRPDASTLDPAIAIAADGSLGMSFMEVGPNEMPSMYVTGRTPADLPNTMAPPILVRAGVVNLPIDPDRTGDFSGISVDPVKGGFWAANEIGLPIWGTWIGHFSFHDAALPVSDMKLSNLTLSPNPINEGGFVAVSGQVTDTNAVDTHDVTIDWGDGASTVLHLGAGLAQAFQSNYQYIDDTGAGASTRFPITVTLSNNHGAIVQTLQPPPSLLAWYAGDGDARDSAGRNDGAVLGGTTFEQGVVGQAFHFDGQTGYVNVPNTPALAGISSAVSMDAWVKPTPLGPGLGYILARRDPYISEGFSVAVRGDGTVVIVVRTSTDPDVQGSIYYSQPGVLPAGVFSHVAVTASTITGEVHLYINGVNQPLANVYGPAVLNGQLSAVQNLFIGRRQAVDGIEGTPGAAYFCGDVDELDLYTRALTPAEVQALYNAGGAGKIKPEVVNNKRPSITNAQINPLPIVAGGTITLDGNFFDAGIADTHTVRVDWGDGSQPTVLTTDGPNPAGTSLDYTGGGTHRFQATHKYLQPGRFFVTVMVTDNDGGMDQTVAPVAGLVTWWKGEGNAGDSWGQDNGFLANGASFGPGKVGQAFHFNGVNQYVNVGNPPDLRLSTNGTIAAWIYPTGHGSGTPDLDFGFQDGDGAGWGGTIINKEDSYEVARFYDGTIRWSFATPNPQHPTDWNWINTGYVAPLNVWTLISVTYDNGLVKTYANGVLVHQYQQAGPIGHVAPYQTDFRIGGRQASDTENAQSQYFDGYIDEVQIYNRTLDDNDERALFQQNNPQAINDPWALPPVVVLTRAPTNVTVTPSSAGILENDSVSLSGTFADADPLSTHTVVIDWGDSSPTTTLQLGAGVTVFSTLSHPYRNNRPGDAPYTITATVVNQTGLSGSSSAGVVVNNAPPAITTLSLSPNPGSANQPVTFSCTFTDVGTLDAHSAEIDWGDGSPFQALAFQPGTYSFSTLHTFNQEGGDGVRVIVHDDDGATDQRLLTIGVNPAQPIQLSLGSNPVPSNVLTTLSGHFDDPMIVPHTVLVHWTDGSADMVLALPPGVPRFATPHVFSHEGEYVPVVTVLSPAGVFGMASITAHVQNLRPVVYLAPFARITEGGSMSGSGSFTDATAGAGPWTATVDYGDGSAPQPLILNADGTFALGHLYVEDGNFPVTVTVTNRFGVSGSATQALHVVDASLLAFGQDVTARPGVAFTNVTVAHFTDLGGPEAAGSYHALIDWGDGTQSEGTIVLTDTGFTVTGDHTYAAKGGFVITVTIQHNNTTTTGVCGASVDDPPQS